MSAQVRTKIRLSRSPNYVEPGAEKAAEIQNDVPISRADALRALAALQA